MAQRIWRSNATCVECSATRQQGDARNRSRSLIRRLFQRRSHKPGQLTAILRNAGYILLGKGLGGLLSLVYVALAARSLGMDGFGHFVLILAFGQSIAGLAQFQTAEVLIRFGAIHLAEHAPHKLARIIGFCAMLDALSALVAVVMALIAGAWLGPLLGLSGQDSERAAWFAASFIGGLRGTPVGILRLFNRFDLAALIDSLIPAVRLIAAATGFLFANSIVWLLAAWAFAEFLATVIVWMAAVQEVRRHSNLPLRQEALRWRQASRENHRLWRFAGFTNLSSSVGFLHKQAGTLLVGWQAGASVAGIYRIAQQLAHAVSKPVAALSRAIYPDLAHVAVAGGAKAVTGLTDRLSIFGALLGIAAVGIVAVAGPWILTAVAGPQFASGSRVLLILTIAAAIELWAFGQEPALLALGRAGAVLAIRATIGVVAIGLMLFLLSRYGVTGAAVAVLVGNVGTRLAMSLALARYTRSTTRPAASIPAAQVLEADKL